MKRLPVPAAHRVACRYIPTNRRLAFHAACAATMSLSMLAACGQPAAGAADAGTQCDSKACFEQQFADCKSATYAKRKHLNGEVQYRILGPGNGGCRVAFRYLHHPIVGLLDKSLRMVLDPQQPFWPQMKDARHCMDKDAPGDYQCSGALRGIAATNGLNDGPTRGEAERSARAGAAHNAHSLCGNTTGFADDKLYALPRNGRWGYVNRNGDWVIKPRWSQVGPFSEGRAVVGEGNNHGTRWGVIDRSGAYVVEPNIPSSHATGPRVPHPPIKPFSQGCAAVTPASGRPDDTPYFITRDGQFWLRDGLPESLAGQKVKEFGSFSGWWAWFRLGDVNGSRQFGYINTQGEVTIEAKYAQAGNFAAGLAPAQIRNDLWGYIDYEGELFWPDKWTLEHARELSQGKAPITTSDGKKAYFDGVGIPIKKLTFDPPRTFEESDGEVRYDSAPIEYADGFNSGLAPVAIDHHVAEWFYMDSQGNAAFSPKLDLGLNVCYRSNNRLERFNKHRLQFRQGLARLRIANKNGKCDEPKKIANGHFETHAQSHYVYIDTDGEIVLEEPYREGDTDALPSRQGDDS